ncbi:MAG: hypothetical protein N3D10_02385 [Candidatus Micrarchaeota archaeon]|nr:hypothetical protein [Candidatus Micrarchaeota archaeon]
MSNNLVVFEISSEVARKIGGIYTVIKTKSSYIQKYYPNSYYYIGFYDERCTQEVKLLSPPSYLKKIFDELAQHGIYCYYGLWLYAENAPTILVDAKQFSSKLVEYTDDNGTNRHDIQLNYIKYQLWRYFTIDSLMEKSWDFSENVAWGWAVGILLEKILNSEEFKTKKVVGQFHEWITGAALLYCKLKNLPIACVFTTHATVLGRTLSATGVDVLSLATTSVTPIELSKAYELRVEGKHQLEVQAAKKADVFTCVSDVVGQEARYILGLYPDKITINGIDLENSIHESEIKNLANYVRAELLQLAEGVFLPYFTARYDNALLVFISGRYEFKNKGFDIFLKGLSYANKEIRTKGTKKDKQIIAFVFTPSSISGPKVSVIKNYLLIDKISEILDALPKISPKKHYPNIIERVENTKNENLYYDLKAMLKNFVKESKDPPISLFDLNYPNDQIILTCLKEGLNNSSSNPVKVLFYPTYLNPNDGLINMNYSDVIAGMDVGVFPSRYEPFGYTPLEAALKCNIAVSTNWAGFGRYLLSSKLYNEKAIKILNLNQSDEKIAQDLGNFFIDLYYSEPEELFKRKEEAFKMTKLFDWAELVKNYVQAYNLAVEKFFTSDRKFYPQALAIGKFSNPLLSAKEKLSFVLYEEKEKDHKHNSKNKKEQKKKLKTKSKK